MIVPDRREGRAGAQVDDAIDILLSLASTPGQREPAPARAERLPPDLPRRPARRAAPRPLPALKPPPVRPVRTRHSKAARRTALAGLVAALAVVPDFGVRPPLAWIAPAQTSLDALARTASTVGEAAYSLGGRLAAVLPVRARAASPPQGAVAAGLEPKPERPAWRDPEPLDALPPADTAEAVAEPPPVPAPATEEAPLLRVPTGVVDHGDPLDPPVDPAVATEPSAAPDRRSDEASPPGAPGDARIEETRAAEPPPVESEPWMESLVEALVAQQPQESELAAAPAPAPLDEEAPPAAPAALPAAAPAAAAAPDEAQDAPAETAAEERGSDLSDAFAREIAGLRAELDHLRARAVETAQAAPAPAPQPSPAPSPAPADAPPPSQATPPLSQSATPGAARLVARAEALIKSHDISGARLLLERAVAEGSAQAAFLLAQTYDPRALAAWGVVGIRPDVSRADQLYARAQAGGVREAGERLSRR